MVGLTMRSYDWDDACMPGLENLFDFGNWEPPEFPELDDFEFPFKGWPTIDAEGNLIDDPNWSLSPKEYSWGNPTHALAPEPPPPDPPPAASDYNTPTARIGPKPG